jgi:hypothetical protein
MRRSTAALLTVGAAALLTAFMVPPKAKAPRVDASMYAAGTNVWVKWTIAASPSDSLTVDLSPTPVGGSHKMYVLDSKTDSVSYPKPAPGASLTVTLLGKNWRKVQGVDKSAAAPPASGTYVEPDTIVVPPSVDLKLMPTSATVAPGGSVQFQVSTNSGKPVTWRVVGVGTVTATGLYTAPL